MIRNIIFILLMMVGLSFGQVTTGFDCEVSDTSPENTWNTWNLIRGESRWLQVNYLHNGVAVPLTNAGISSASLSLKASDSTITYVLAGETSPQTGVGSEKLPDSVLWVVGGFVPVSFPARRHPRGL